MIFLPIFSCIKIYFVGMPFPMLLEWLQIAANSGQGPYQAANSEATISFFYY